MTRRSWSTRPDFTSNPSTSRNVNERGGNHMKKAVAAALLLSPPALAQAEPPAQVPAIVRADAAAAASASVSERARHATTGAEAMPAGVTRPVAAAAPAAQPPPISLVSPSARLNAKERHAVSLARRWVSRAEMPQRGADGVIRYLRRCRPSCARRSRSAILRCSRARSSTAETAGSVAGEGIPQNPIETVSIIVAWLRYKRPVRACRRFE